MEYNKEACEEIHKNIEGRLDTNDKRLNNHAGRIDNLEYSKGQAEIRIENLCLQIKSLVTTMRWFIGLLITGLGSFIFYLIQQFLLRR
ncbi:MAG: hemolysin XhlA family protein [Clostridia bacterium]|jgi:hypothetical protein